MEQKTDEQYQGREDETETDQEYGDDVHVCGVAVEYEESDCGWD